MSNEWRDVEARGFHRREMLPMLGHVVPRGESWVTTIVVPDPVLRVRVLDARSRQAIKGALLHGAWVLPAGTAPPEPGDESSYNAYSAAHVPAPIDWNVKDDHPIVGKPTKGFVKGDWSHLKHSLNLLGYTAGAGKKDDKDLQDALHQFREDHGIAQPKPNAKDKETIPRVIAEHNRRAFDMVRRYLRAFDISCPGSGDWDSTAEEALVEWQHIWLHKTGPLPKFPTKAICRKLVAENNHFTTNADGVISIPIPMPLMKAGFTVVVSFAQFGVVSAKDAPRWRADGEVLVEWPGSQDLKTGKLGWRLRAPGDNGATAALPEFRWSHAIRVPAIPKLTFAELPAADAAQAGFNASYAGKGAVHVDLIGLVWCQPMWDDIEDPKTHESNTNVVMPVHRPTSLPGAAATAAPPRRRHLHIVTKWSGKDPEFYGWLDAPAAGLTHFRLNVNNPGYRHRGTDVFVRNLGDPVFAFHGGNAKPISQTSGGQVVGAGHYVTLTDPTNKHIHLQYFHLEQAGRAKGAVRAGEIIGKFGHTGNINNDSAAPNHCHVEHHQDVNSDFGLAAFADHANQVCLPSPTETPRVFPCKCTVQGAPSVQSCRFDDPTFTNGCWAPKRLICPHMFDSDPIFRYQAQLRYAGESVAVTGQDDLQYKKAINSFRKKHGMPEDGTVNQDVVIELDNEAPIIRPE